MEAAQGAGEFPRSKRARPRKRRCSALKDLQAYLKITAPFDGVVTERLVHPGALVGPGRRCRCW